MRKQSGIAILFLLFSSVCLAGFFLSPTIGPAWDEPDNIHAAGVYRRFVQRGFDRMVLENADRSSSYYSEKIFTQEPTIARYPPVPLYVGNAVTSVWEKLSGAISPQEIIVAFHYATTLFFALLVVTEYKFARLLGLSTPTSVFAAFATFLFPTIFGHGLSNIKDTAQVSLFTLALYYVVRMGRRDKGDWGGLVRGAVVWGLALATKFNAIYVPVIWGLWYFRFTLDQLGKLVKRGVIILAVGLATAILVWPYLWFDPVGHAKEVIGYFTTVGTGYRIVWDGALYHVGVGQRLWWYPWAGLVLATPIPLLVLVGIGAIRAVGEMRVNPKKALLFIWITVPMLRALLPNAAFYDGIRHFMEVLPAWILLAAIGVETIILMIQKYIRRTWLHGSMVPWLIVGQLAFINITYFPFSTGYYNLLAKDPNVRYDRDIESLAVKEGVEYLHRKYGNIALWAPIGGHLSWYYLVGGDQYVYYPAGADSIILVNKSSHIRESEFTPALSATHRLDYTIARGPAVFGWVYRRR